MRSGFVVAAVLVVSLNAGCGSDAPQRRRSTSSGPGEEFLSERGSSSSSSSSGPREREDGLVVDREEGALDQRDVDRVLKDHLRAMVACYDRAGEAQRYASGEVALKFMVAPAGAVTDVLVTQSALGNFAVERCLVAEGRRMVFPPPGGRRGTDFDYSLRFRSSGEQTVVDWDAGVFQRDIGTQSAQLATCNIPSHSMRAVVYVYPGGSIGSVGLSSEVPLDPAAAACVVEQMSRWKLPDDRSHVVRTSFPVVVTAPAAPPPPRRSAQKVTRRGRRSLR